MPNKCVSPYPENKTSKMCCQNICQEAVTLLLLSMTRSLVWVDYVCNLSATSKMPNSRRENELLFNSNTRIKWSGSLEELFVSAIHTIGIENATPTAIKKEMDVPYLTRLQVSSHLQKYRKKMAKLNGENFSQKYKHSVNFLINS